jgi:hypothetical protein
MTSHELIRIERINKIKATLEKAKKEKKSIDEKKLIGMCCMEWGTTENTVKGYLKIIRMAE